MNQILLPRLTPARFRLIVLLVVAGLMTTALIGGFITNNMQPFQLLISFLAGGGLMSFVMPFPEETPRNNKGNHQPLARGKALPTPIPAERGIPFPAVFRNTPEEEGEQKPHASDTKKTVGPN